MKQNGPATIAQLAEALGLTGEAVRQQLLLLHREGWTEARIDRTPIDRSRTGRPSTTYRLTAAGDHLFPKEYDALNVAVIDAVSEELGPEATKLVLKHLCDARVAAVAPSLAGRSLAERVELLKTWYLEDDPYMQSEVVDGDHRLLERNCPFLNTAMRRPALCSVSVNALTRLLGVRVRREERFQSGHGRCAFRAYANEPIDPDTWEFQLESEMS